MPSCPNLALRQQAPDEIHCFWREVVCLPKLQYAQILQVANVVGDVFKGVAPEVEFFQALKVFLCLGDAGAKEVVLRRSMWWQGNARPRF